MPNQNITERKTEQRFTYNTIDTALGNAGKVIPQAVNFEKAVLGAMMIDRDAASNVATTLRSNMFYKDAHQVIFSTMMALAEKDEPIDLLTVTDKLRSEKKLEFVGGPGYLASLTNQVASAANIEYHARIVMERFVLRQLISTCTDITKKAYEGPSDVMELMDSAETELFNIIESNFSRESKELGTITQSALREMAQKMAEKAERMEEGAITGVPTGIKKLDETLGGWQNSDLIIIAARPGMGKTSFVLSIARNAAIDYGKHVAFFSLEMSSTQLAHRLFSIESGINASKIARANLDENEWNQLMDKVQVLINDKIIIDDTPGLSIFDLRAKCRRLKQRYDIDLVIIDYLQLMQGNSEEKSRGNREQEISQISRSLKALAKDLNIPVIALAQLSRQVEVRGGDKIPLLSDLRESGSIEQDADQVLFIYRPEYYKMEDFPDNTPAKGKADIIIAKNRHGSVENVRMKFISKFTKFDDDDDNFAENPLDPTAGIAPNEQQFMTLDSSINEDNGLPY